MLGGTSDAKDATPEIQAHCDTLKSQAEEQAGTEFDTFEALSYKSQVVAGTNYFVKVHVGNDECVHLRVFVPLPHTNSPAELHGIQLGKSRDDEISHF